MLTSHFRYLRSAVRLATARKESEQILNMLADKRVSAHPVYRLINDIVTDARFYYVTDDDDFWQTYSTAEIRSFIDSVDEGIWRDEQELTLHKEEFLNQWLSSHIIPMTEQEKERKRRQALMSLLGAGLSDGMKIKGGAADGFPIGIHDMTEDDTEDSGSEGEDPESPPDSSARSRNPDSLPEEIERLDHAHRSAGRGKATTITAQYEFLSRIDPELLRLAMMIGRSGGEAPSLSASRFGHGQRSDISGITVGDDLNSLLTTELAMLATPETYDIFLRKFTSKRLQIFSSASHSMQKGRDECGPIIMCIDTSSSMEGAPEMMAKTLVMAVAVIAQRDKRPVLVVNYSHQVSFFVLTDLRHQWSRFVSFLSMSYMGGNDENLLFDFVFSQLPQTARYKQVVKNFENADLLLISDFIWMPVHTDTVDLIEKAHTSGMKFYTLEVGGEQFEHLNWEELPANGEWFIQISDHYFIYNQGKLSQQK